MASTCNKPEVFDCDCSDKIRKLIENSNGDLCLNHTTLIEAPKLSICSKHGKLVKKLFMKRNLFASLPEEYMQQLNKLVELYVPGNKLQSLPNGIGTVKSLRRLDANANCISVLPDSFTELHELQSVTLRDNVLKYLPEHIGKLKNLVDLDLSNNQLDCIPGSIGCLTKLDELNLSCNNLTTLPSEICKLDNVHDFFLSMNKLVYLPIGIGNVATNLFLFDNKMLSFLPEDAIYALYTGCGQGQGSISDEEAGKYGLYWGVLNDGESDIRCLLPWHAQVGNYVPSLVELATRELYYEYDEDISWVGQFMPPMMRERINFPIAECSKCENKMFWETSVRFHSKVKVLSRTNKLITGHMNFLSFHCSEYCHRRPPYISADSAPSHHSFNLFDESEFDF